MVGVEFAFEEKVGKVVDGSGVSAVYIHPILPDTAPESGRKHTDRVSHNRCPEAPFCLAFCFCLPKRRCRGGFRICASTCGVRLEDDELANHLPASIV